MEQAFDLCLGYYNLYVNCIVRVLDGLSARSRQPNLPSQMVLIDFRVFPSLCTRLCLLIHLLTLWYLATLDFRWNSGINRDALITIAPMETANPCSLSSKINLSRSFSIGFNIVVGPAEVLLAFKLPCSMMALRFVDHSRYCFGIILSALHAPLIDSPASTRLLTFRTIASLSKFAKRRLLPLEVVLGVPPTWQSCTIVVVIMIQTGGE